MYIGVLQPALVEFDLGCFISYWIDDPKKQEILCPGCDKLFAFLPEPCCLISCLEILFSYMPNNWQTNNDCSVSKHQVCADTMSQVGLFVDHVPFCCNSVFADGGLVTSRVTSLLKISVSWSLH